MSKIKESMLTSEINDSSASIQRIKWLLIAHGISWLTFGIIILLVGDTELALLVNPGDSMTESHPIYIMVKLLSDTFIIWMFFILILTIVVLAVPKLENYQRPMLETLYAYIFAGIFIEFLKPVVNRVRPFDALAEINVFGETTDTGSMPSGHVGYTGAAVLPHAIRLKRIIIVVVIFLYNAGMMYTRMFLGVHYASDVLVGNIISLGVSTLSFFLFEQIYRKKEINRKHQWLLFVVGIALFFISQGILRNI